QGYALFYSTSSKESKYAEAVTLMSYMKFDDVKKWEHTFNTVSHEVSRGEDYELFKTQMAERLIESVEKRQPGFRACIQSYYVATPLTSRDYIGNDDGSLYGFVKDYREPLKSFISPRTKIPNFFLTGQNLNLHGVLGVTVSAVVTCSEIVGRKELIEKINNA
ncbi:MAG: all-trans-retinol 13,14-reductase, partial [Azospira oryzae]